MATTIKVTASISLKLYIILAYSSNQIHKPRAHSNFV